MARGGKRTPRDPAPVSGPGRMARRTDGGPTDVPAYASASGERPYGERKAVEAQAAAAPMAREGGGPAPAQAQGRPNPLLEQGLFGPTQRPWEPPTTGAMLGPGPGPQQPILDDDPDLLLRAIVKEFPHPDLIRLLNG